VYEIPTNTFPTMIQVDTEKLNLWQKEWLKGSSFDLIGPFVESP
jgi:hypothetical protein